MGIWAISDIHGNYELYEKVNNFIKPEDTVYFLGDAADRGPDGWKIIKAILKNPQWVYLKGNHEDMLINARKYRSEWNLLFCNGGKVTFWDMENDPEAEDIVNQLVLLPTVATITNTSGLEIYMSHSGYLAENASEEDLLWDRSHYFDTIYEDGDPTIVHGHTPAKMIARDLSIPYNEKDGMLQYSINKYCIDCWTAATGRCVLLNLDTFESIVFETKKEN